jgi:hypothetical protein
MYIRLIPHYLLWHYTSGIGDYLGVARRLLAAIAKIFSLKLMLRTFFDPFERLGEHYHRGGVSAFFETFVVNMIMRIVGIIVRSCVIVIGVLCLLCGTVFCLAGTVMWLVLPVVPALLMYVGIANLIKAL